MKLFGLLSMLDQGIPSQMIRLLISFLSDRRARVNLHGHLSKSYIFKQCLPQGSVLAPLLFLFYINNLAEILPGDVLLELFADDVKILATSPPLKGSKTIPWCGTESRGSGRCCPEVERGMENAGKSEVYIFLRDTKDAQLRPAIVVGAKAIKFNPTPGLLGTMLDRQLTFPHT